MSNKDLEAIRHLNFEQASNRMAEAVAAATGQSITETKKWLSRIPNHDRMSPSELTAAASSEEAKEVFARQLDFVKSYNLAADKIGWPKVPTSDEIKDLVEQD